MIDRLCDQADAGDMAVACVYCDFHDHHEHSTAELLGVVLKQLVDVQGPILDRAFSKSERGLGGRRLLLPDIQEMLINSCQQRVFICIDALDEFSAKSRPQLWESLQQVVRRCPNLRLFLTGRLHIREEVQKYFPAKAEMLRMSHRERDIRLYLSMRLSESEALEPDAMDEELKADILKIVLEVVVRTWVFSRWIQF